MIQRHGKKNKKRANVYEYLKLLSFDFEKLNSQQEINCFKLENNKISIFHN